MRYLLIIFIFFVGLKKGICDTPLSSIEINYKAHQIIFYGEFLGCYELKHAYGIYGYPIIIENYRIIKKIKGFELAFDDSIASDIISVRHIESKLDKNYCESLIGKSLIIYANKRFYHSSSFPFYNSEFPSRVIVDNDFMVEESTLEEEIGKNELELLIKYKNYDSVDYRAQKRKSLGESNYHKNLISVQMKVIGMLKEQININKIKIIVLEVALGIAAFWIIISFFKNRT